MRAVSLRAVTAVACALALGVSTAEGYEDPDTELAHRHFQRGSEHYAAGAYDRAIEEFQAAKRTKQLPAFDYNIALCHDRLGHEAEAIAYYRSFLASTKTDAEEPEVRQRVRVLEARLSARTQPGRRERLAGWSTGAVGLGLIAAGVGLGVRSAQDGDDLTRRFAGGAAWDPAARALEQEGQRFGGAAIALYIVGGASVAIGAVLLSVGVRRLRASSTAAR